MADIKKYETDIMRLVKAFVSRHKTYTHLYGDTDDFIQSLLLKAYRVMPYFDETKTKLSTYLWVIFRNDLFIKLRKYKRFTIVNLSEPVGYGQDGDYITLEDILPSDYIEDNEDRLNARLDYSSLTNIISTYCSPSVIDVLVNNLTLREAGKKYNCSAQNVRNTICKQINKLNLVLLYPNDFDYNYITMSRKQFRIYYMKIHNCSPQLFRSRMKKIKEEYKPINIYILHKGRKINESYC